MRIWRTVLWIGLVLVLLLVVWIGRVVWWSMNAKPGSAVDFASQLNELAAKHQKDDPRPGDAYATLVEATEEYEKIWSAAEFEAKGGAERKPPYWPPAHDWPLDLQLIAPLREVTSDETVYADAESTRVAAEHLETARRNTRRAMEALNAGGINELLDTLAASKPGVRMVPSGTKWLEVMLPTLGPTRSIARYNMARMRSAALAGDHDEMVRAFDRAMAIGVTLMHQTTLIERLTGNAILAMAEANLSEILRYAPEAVRPNAATLRRLMAALDRADARPPMELAMNAERLGVLDTIQWTHSDDGNGDGYLLPEQLTRVMATPGASMPGGVPGAMIARIGLATKKQTTRKANEFYDAVVDLTKMTPAERRQHPVNTDLLVQRLGVRDMLLKMLLPGFGSAMGTEDKLQLTLSGLRTQLALELFRLERGDYPEALAELVPAYLKVLPLDLYSADSKQVLRYRRPGPEGDTRPYLLYTVGVDGLDQGGKETPKESDRVLPLKNMNGGAGFDYVLAPVR